MNKFNMTAIAGTAGVLGLLKAFQGLANGVKNVISNYSHFESMQKGLETFFQSADKGKEKFEELRKLSNETTFGVDELANSFTQLANVGTDVDTINDKLMMLGNISGGNKQKFAELVSIYSKILSVGKAGSEQIQMLAMRGVPIYDMLKKMGIQGTASADDITKAFEKMTEQGGQFYNAMNNINDTIEGKEGFIKDYFTEMTVNFAEVSGLADTYKTILDVLKNAIGVISDKLLEINENPVYKAIFQGVLITAITTIATVISVSLLPQLAKLIASLTTINLLQGPKGWAVLAVAGIGAGITALMAYKAKQKEVTDEIKETNNAVSEYNRLISQGQYESAYNSAISDSQTKIQMLTEKISEAQNKLGSIRDFNFPNYYNLEKNGTEFETSSDIQKEIDDLNEQLKEQQNILKSNKQMLDALKTNEVANEIINAINAENEKIKKDNPITEIESQIEVLEKALSNIPISLSINGIIDDSNKERVEELTQAIDYLNKKLKDLKSENSWTEYWKKVTGIDVSNIKRVDNKSLGQLAGETTVESLRKELNKQLEINDFLGGGNENANKIRNDMVEKVQNYIKELLSKTGLDSDFTVTDFSITALKKFADELKTTTDELENTTDKLNSLEDFITILNEKAQEAAKNKNYGQFTGYSIASTGLSYMQNSDVGTAIESFYKYGDAGIAIIETLVNSLFKVISSLEYFEEAINPITNILEQFKPLLRIIVDIMALNTNFIATILKLFNSIKIAGKSISDWLNTFAEGLENLLGFLFGTEESLDDSSQAIQSLTQEIKSLTQAMQEQEEYYRAMQKKLISDSYIDEVYKVNDMILTPQGKFSTSPEDYIIATKNPYALGNNTNKSVVYLQPIINNNVADSVDVSITQQQDENNMNRLVVTLSRKIASDVARGVNGWDSALSSRQVRLQGRGVLS